MPSPLFSLNPGTSDFPFTNDNPTIPFENGPQATIEIGEISPDDTLALWDGEAGSQGIWTDFEVHNHYEKDGHIYMMPISSPDGFSSQSQQQVSSPGGTLINNQTTQTVAFVQLAAKTLLWVCEWTACKFNEQPEIPDPDSLSDPNWVLLDDHYESVNVVVAPDGVTGLYRISGVYVFGHLKPDEVTINNVSFGRHPLLSDQFTFGRTMPLNKLTSNLIDTDQNQPIG